MAKQDTARQGRGAGVPVTIKPEYIGLAGAKPTLTALEFGSHYFAYDTGAWSIWDGASWRDFTSPAVPVSVTVGALAFSDGADATEGAKADAAVTDPTASATVVSLLKGALKAAAPPRLVTGLKYTTLTCVNANQDYNTGAAVAAGFVRARVRALANEAVIAIEATTAAPLGAGVALHADTDYDFSVSPGDTLHARSTTAGTVVSISYLKS